MLGQQPLQHLCIDPEMDQDTAVDDPAQDGSVHGLPQEWPRRVFANPMPAAGRRWI
jgi:hypothetical protein